MRRGFSLLEAVVVLAITVTVLLTALPIAVSLLREQKGLAAEVLRGETLPLLHGRLDRDLGNARGMEVAPDPESGGARLLLAPRDEHGSQVVWTIGGTTLERREIPADDAAAPPPHTWTVDGALSLDPLELASGRLGLLWQPSAGPTELIVFEAPRSEEAVN